MTEDNGAGAGPRSASAPSECARTAVATLGMLPALVLLALGVLGDQPALHDAIPICMIVLQQSAINIVLAAGMTFVILTGGIDLRSAPSSQLPQWSR